MDITSAMIGIGIMALGFSVMVKSRVLREPANRWPLLGRKLRKVSIVFFSAGGVLFAMGANNPQLFSQYTYIPVGVMLIVLGIIHQIQGMELILPKAELPEFGRKIWPLALVCVIGGVILVVVAVGRILCSAG